MAEVGCSGFLLKPNKRVRIRSFFIVRLKRYAAHHHCWGTQPNRQLLAPSSIRISAGAVGSSVQIIKPGAPITRRERELNFNASNSSERLNFSLAIVRQPFSDRTQIYASQRRLQLDDNLSDLLIRFDVLMGGNDVLEFENLRDNRLERSRL